MQIKNETVLILIIFAQPYIETCMLCAIYFACSKEMYRSTRLLIAFPTSRRLKYKGEDQKGYSIFNMFGRFGQRHTCFDLGRNSNQEDTPDN